MLIPQVEHNLLTVNALDTNFLEHMAKNLLQRRIDFCDLYLQSTTSEAFSIDEGIIKSGSFAIDQGIGIRAVCGEKTFLSYSNSLNPKTITNLVSNIFIEPVHAQMHTPNPNEHNPNNLYMLDNPITNHSGSEKTAILAKIDSLARSQPYVTNVLASLSLEYDEICILNSRLKFASDIRPLVHLSVTVIISKNGVIEKGTCGGGGRYSISNFSDVVITDYVNQAYNQALIKSEAANCPGGQMPVVLGNGWAGVILHEAVGHGLEGDFNRRGSSAFSNRINQQVASKNVTVIDEGCIPNRRGSLSEAI